MISHTYFFRTAKVSGETIYSKFYKTKYCKTPLLLIFCSFYTRLKIIEKSDRYNNVLNFKK
ncbi:MAG: hypothetical protein BGP13_21010 [Sphingobacteriales bacterium 40-81]|nr:MAG: hypothetical protein BGP13_21010 [Sphingobacteriales bacterium 40-81]